jgi:hypothetical protein
LKTNLSPAGHGGTSGRYDRLKDDAFDYAFLLTQMGIENQDSRTASHSLFAPTGVESLGFVSHHQLAKLADSRQLRQEPKVPHSKQLPAQQHTPTCGV